MSVGNSLAYFFDNADRQDLDDSLRAYSVYKCLMSRFASEYNVDREKVTAAFCALSPNSDYFGNLRSLRSVLEATRLGLDDSQVVVSTYAACGARALRFIRGEAEFMKVTKGLKTRAFWTNIEHPTVAGAVTVDGHMKAAWLGVDRHTMRQAAVKSEGEYHAISRAVTDLAVARGVLPHQAQAVVWMARKRLLRVKFNAQLDLFNGTGLDFPLSDIRPYPFRKKNDGQEA